MVVVVPAASPGRWHRTSVIEVVIAATARVAGVVAFAVIVARAWCRHLAPLQPTAGSELGRLLAFAFALLSLLDALEPVLLLRFFVERTALDMVALDAQGGAHALVGGLLGESEFVRLMLFDLAPASLRSFHAGHCGSLCSEQASAQSRDLALNLVRLHGVVLEAELQLEALDLDRAPPLMLQDALVWCPVRDWPFRVLV